MCIEVHIHKCVYTNIYVCIYTYIYKVQGITTRSASARSCSSWSVTLSTCIRVYSINSFA